MSKVAFSILVSFSILIQFGLGSCKTKAHSSKSKDTLKETIPTDSYSLVITFFSIGTGVDYKTKKLFDEWTVNFEQKIGKKVQIESYPWGREGEVDLCISTDNLSADQKKEFINESKKLVSNSKLVRLEENVKCKRKS
jgi:ABC-type glycerol-3-phosphate transport system substrate-binding protein